MLKREIKYTNPFTDAEVTELHYFHISKADLVEMEMEEHKSEYVDNKGETLTGMQAKLQKIVDADDGRAILAEFKDILRRSYGKKEGDRFIKSKEIWDDFASSEAYSQLLFDLFTNGDVAAEFISGIIPGNLEQIAAEVREKAAEGDESSVGAIAAYDDAAKKLGAPTTDSLPNDRILTQAEVAEMDSDELKSGLATGKYKLS